MRGIDARQAGHVPACRISGEAGEARDRARLLAQLSAYYREVGWWVDACADDGADLCLRRGRDVVLLRAMAECDGAFDVATMHRFAEAVARFPATGGVAIAAAGFDPDAVDAASVKIKCVDAAALHGMLGELPAEPAPGDPFAEASPAPVEASPPRARMRMRWWALAIACALACVAYAGLRVAHAHARPIRPREDRVSAVAIAPCNAGSVDRRDWRTSRW